MEGIHGDPDRHVSNLDLVILRRWACLLRLLSDQQGQLEVVKSQSVVVECVDVHKEAHVLNGFLRRFFAFH